MDDIVITLPCGLNTKYQEVFYQSGKFKCPACKSHTTSAEECSEMTINKLAINQHVLDCSSKILSDNLKHLEALEIDPSFYIDDNYSQLINQIDIRREEIKLLINNEIDNYYESLLLKIDTEKKLKFNEFNEKIEKINYSKNEMDISEISTDLDNNSKLDMINQKLDNIDNLIYSTNSAISDLTTNNLVLNQSKNWNIADIFGDLDLVQEKQSSSFENSKISTETTLRLPIGNFSQFINEKNLEIFAGPVQVQNVEWSIHAKPVEQNDGQIELEYSLKSHSLTNDLNNHHLIAELRVLHPTDSAKNLVSKIQSQITQPNGNSYFKFLSTIDLTDTEKDFYNTLNDSVVLEAWIRQEHVEKSKYQDKVIDGINFLDNEDSDSNNDSDSNISSSDSSSHFDSDSSSHYDSDSDFDADLDSDSDSDSNSDIDDDSEFD